MSKADFVPITELREDESHPTVNWHVELPSYVPQDEIGVNTDLLARMARLGGLSDVTIVSYSGEVTTITPSGGKPNEDGTITAANAVEKRAQLGQGMAQDPTLEANVSGHYDFYWTPATVKLNISEMTDRLSHRRGGKLRDPRAWSSVIDGGLSQGMRDATKQALITNVPFGDKISPIALAPGLGLLATLDHNIVETLISGPFYVGAYQVLKAFEGHYRKGLPLGEKRWSLLPAIQLDRVVALNALTRVSRVAKNIKK